MAAAAVFKNREQQPASLSAAAAAAALRARPMTPTNVGQVQTKRTMRRTPSVSSAGTAPDARERPGLHRSGSSASMTERTFRSPSPAARRPSSSASDHVSGQSREAAPPVPALPKDVDKMSGAQHRKTQSLQLSNPPLRLASQTLGKSGTGSWFGAAHVGDLSNVRTSDAAMASPPLSPPPLITHPGDDERPDSRNSSVNFSYPSRVRIGSPTPESPTAARGHESPQPTRAQDQAAKRASSGSSSLRARPASTGTVQSMVYDPNSRRMIPREVATYDDPIGPSGRSLSVRKKKKQPAMTGTHLSQGTMGRTKVAPTVAAYDNVQPQAVRSTSPNAAQGELQHQPQELLTTSYHIVDDETDHTAAHHPAITDAPSKSEQPGETTRVPFPTHAATNLVDPTPREPSQQPQQDTNEEPAVKSLISAPRSDAKKSEQQRLQKPVGPTSQTEDENTGPKEFTWAGQGVRRQPSTVKEEPEPEDIHGHFVADALDAVPTKQKVFQPAAQQPQPVVARTKSDPYATPARQPATGETFRPADISPASDSQPTTLQGRRTSGIQRERSVSSSPVRTAHFGSVQDSLTVKHCPPPRSVSPRKSALKNSTSPDRRSLDDNESEVSTTFSQRDDATVARKRSVRVSFDDSNTVVVGESPGPALGDSLILASPPNARRPWYGNIGRAKKTEMASLDDDEIMKPRPVLPSFGSVRDKKPRDNIASNEERPLVRPVPDASTSPSVSASASSLPPIPHVSDELLTDTSLAAMTTSGDSAAPTQAESDQRARIAANTSRFREPLPPVVTSIEGTGYASDTASSEDEQTQAVSTDQVRTEADGNRTDTQPPVHQQGAIPDVSTARSSNRLSEVSIASSDASFQDAASIAEQGDNIAHQDIPTIAVSTPTPPPAKDKSSKYFDVPGGFPEDDSEPPTPDADPRSGTEHVPASESSGSTTPTPVRQGTFEPQVRPENAIHTPQIPASVIAPLAPAEEEKDEDDNSSIYSDASDHFTDTENGGFMSLDAIVESPIPTKAYKPESSPSTVTATPHLGTELSTATTAVETTQPGEPTALDWDKAKAYWRSLTAEKRVQLEKEALSDAGVDADVEEDLEASKKPKKKKSIERRNSERKALAERMAQQTIAAQQHKMAEEERFRASERTYMIKPGTKVGADHSTQQRIEEKPRTDAKNPDTASKLRTSMRTNGAAPKPSKQMEQPRQHALGAKTLRPASVGQAPSVTKSMKSSQRASAPPVAAAAARNSFNPPPANRRRGSDSSESSFRRSSHAESGQGFGFRKTLRQQSPAQNDRATRPSGRFSLRSLSPPSPPSRSGPSGGMGMRTSLRGSANHTKTNSGGMHFGGFGKGSAKSRPKSTAGSSRFSDSSDDDARPRTFRSRFDESSDEDDMPLPAPLSIPKTMRGSQQGTEARANRRYQPSELSPPLPEEQEESDREGEGPISPLPQSKGASRSGRGGFGAPSAATKPEAPKSSRRGSFLSVLRRKKDKNKAGGISRPEVMDSAARRDTKLERSASELMNIRRSGEELDGDSGEMAAVRPRSPRLQKRTNSMPLDAAVGGTWPLGSPGSEHPPTNGVDGMGRPATSGNLGTRTMSGLRPAFGQRRTASSITYAGTAVEVGSVAGTVGGERKKKKFGALRKMFRLDE